MKRTCARTFQKNVIIRHSQANKDALIAYVPRIVATGPEVFRSGHCSQFAPSTCPDHSTNGVNARHALRTSFSVRGLSNHDGLG